MRKEMSKKSSFLFSFPEPTPDNVTLCALKLLTHLILTTLTGGVWMVFIIIMALAPDNENRKR